MVVVGVEGVKVLPHLASNRVASSPSSNKDVVDPVFATATVAESVGLLDLSRLPLEGEEAQSPADPDTHAPVPLSIGRQSDIKLGETYTGLGLGLLEEDKVAAHVHQLVLVVLVFAAMRVASTMAKEESGPPVHAAVTVGTS